jgi:AraC family carnitine catabolism transcriptional activator
LAEETIQRPSADRGIETIGFLLVPDYPIYALIPALEALRVANQSTGRRLYDWSIISVDGQPVRAGSGMTMTADAGIATAPPLPAVVVCAGNRPTQHISRALLGWLQRLDRQGAMLGAIDTGVFTLAAAGLLNGTRVTLHWEAIPVFREAYPDIDVVEQLYVIDRRRWTCAGGMAALDMMLHLIAQRHGESLAHVIAEGFLHDRPRRGAEPQRPVLSEKGNRDGGRLLAVLRHMERHVDTPLAAGALAEASGLSVRQVQRLVRRRLGDSPMRYYLKVRLQAARNLLFYSDRPIHEVALACGFSSPQLFARTFRREFGHSPRVFRRQFSGERLHWFRPQISRRIGLPDAAERGPRLPA